MSESTYIRVGKAALADYNNAIIELYGDDDTYSLDALTRLFEVRYGRDGLIEIGRAISNSQLGLRRSGEAMERVAEKIKDGMKVPSPFELSQGVAEELSSWDFSVFSSAGSEVFKRAENFSDDVFETAGDITKGVAKSGTSLFSNLSIIIYGLLAVIAFTFYTRFSK